MSSGPQGIVNDPPKPRSARVSELTDKTRLVLTWGGAITAGALLLAVGGIWNEFGHIKANNNDHARRLTVIEDRMTRLEGGIGRIEEGQRTAIYKLEMTQTTITEVRVALERKADKRNGG